MIAPDEVLLRNIESQHLYCDENSFESTTKITKRKYKLAGEIFAPLNIYAFFVTTTNKTSCSFLHIVVNANDWILLVGGYLAKKVGYIDINKVDVFTGDELILKMKDVTNSYKKIAKLNDRKYKELQELRKDAHKIKMDLTKLALVNIALSEPIDNFSDDILIKLGLK
jgi:hypothetical protein